MSPALTHCSNSATVGAGSEPVNPPIAITALPPLASSRLAALFDPSTAAAQRVVVFSSALSSADEVPAPRGLPPPKPPSAPPAREVPDGRAPRSVPAAPETPAGPASAPAAGAPPSPNSSLNPLGGPELPRAPETPGP